MKITKLFVVVFVASMFQASALFGMWDGTKKVVVKCGSKALPYVYKVFTKDVIKIGGGMFAGGTAMYLGVAMKNYFFGTSKEKIVVEQELQDAIAVDKVTTRCLFRLEKGETIPISKEGLAYDIYKKGKEAILSPIKKIFNGETEKIYGLPNIWKEKLMGAYLDMRDYGYLLSVLQKAQKEDKDPKCFYGNGGVDCRTEDGKRVEPDKVVALFMSKKDHEKKCEEIEMSYKK